MVVFCGLTRDGDDMGGVVEHELSTFNFLLRRASDPRICLVLKHFKKVELELRLVIWMHISHPILPRT